MMYHRNRLHVFARRDSGLFLVNIREHCLIRYIFCVHVRLSDTSYSHGTLRLGNVRFPVDYCLSRRIGWTVTLL